MQTFFIAEESIMPFTFCPERRRRSTVRRSFFKEDVLTPTYFIFNWNTNEFVPCVSLYQCRSRAFGENKEHNNQHWRACVWTKDYFVCM